VRLAACVACPYLSQTLAALGADIPVSAACETHRPVLASAPAAVAVTLRLTCPVRRLPGRPRRRISLQPAALPRRIDLANC
jgi:hypothetical protein